MRHFEIILNRCTDDVFENEVTCDVPGCGNKGSVAIICGGRICSTCLDVAQVAIQREIYKQIKSPLPPYEELPMQTFNK